MSTVAIVLIVLVVLIVLLAVGGYIANSRRLEAERARLSDLIRQADEQLALAHAQDKGWQRETLYAAARAAAVGQLGHEPNELHLIQVIDNPGIEDDEAVFDADGRRVVLERRDDSWLAKA